MRSNSTENYHKTGTVIFAESKRRKKSEAESTIFLPLLNGKTAGMLFKEVIGQQRIKNKLIQTVKENRISHAQLFLGEEGCGNFPMALAYATYVACQNRGDTDSCGVCPGCLKYAKLIHPDLHFVFPVNTNKSVTKDPKSDDFLTQWREFVLTTPYFHESQWYDFIGIENKQGFIGTEESRQILRKLNLKPYESDYKVMIIWLPEKMNASAANKILKIIEEPSDNTLFLLVSETTDGMLPTILSRVQLIKFQGIEEEELKSALQTKFQLSGNQLDTLAHVASGDYLKALESVELNEENSLFLKQFREYMLNAYKSDIQKLTETTDELASLGREKQKRFLEYSLGLVRENLALNYGKEEIVYLNEEEKNFSSRFHPFVNPQAAPRIYELLNAALRDIEANGYAKIVFMDVGLKMSEVFKK